MGTHKTFQSFNLSFIQLNVSLIGFSVILYQFRIVLTPTHSAKGLHWLWRVIIDFFIQEKSFNVRNDNHNNDNNDNI